MGMKGTGGADGSPMGKDRHWSCHSEKFGKPRGWSSSPNIQNLPVRTETGRQVREAFTKAILNPKAAKTGPYNRSANAERSYRVLDRVDAIGRSRILAECPFCFQTFWAYIWSLSGGGKKCPNCGAIHGSLGLARPVEGNEDLS